MEYERIRNSVRCRFFFWLWRKGNAVSSWAGKKASSMLREANDYDRRLAENTRKFNEARKA